MNLQLNTPLADIIHANLIPRMESRLLRVQQKSQGTRPS